MTKRDVVLQALAFEKPPYVPWHIGLTIDCAARLREHLGVDDLSGFLDNHFVNVTSHIDDFQQVDEAHVRDRYGVLWDRSIDKDIGTPVDWPIKAPADLDRYEWPDVADPALYADIPSRLAGCRDRFSRYGLGFSLYERAWTMRGMSNLLMDMVERPEFVHEFLDRIVEQNLIQIQKALELGVDCVHFGDDYGMQTGLIMGIRHWREFIKPRLARMFEPVIAAGKVVSMHSCGRVQELFDELVEIGLKMFNPFQPEVMDVFEHLRRYRGKLAFHGGMSVQKVLPFGTPEEVRRATEELIQAGRDGGYVFAPSHDAPRDVPPENLVAMMEILKAQPGAPA